MIKSYLFGINNLDDINIRHPDLAKLESSIDALAWPCLIHVNECLATYLKSPPFEQENTLLRPLLSLLSEVIASPSSLSNGKKLKILMAGVGKWLLLICEQCTDISQIKKAQFNARLDGLKGIYLLLLILPYKLDTVPSYLLPRGMKNEAKILSQDVRSAYCLQQDWLGALDEVKGFHQRVTQDLSLLSSRLLCFEEKLSQQAQQAVPSWEGRDLQLARLKSLSLLLQSDPSANFMPTFWQHYQSKALFGHLLNDLGLSEPEKTAWLYDHAYCTSPSSGRFFQQLFNAKALYYWFKGQWLNPAKIQHALDRRLSQWSSRRGQGKVTIDEIIKANPFDKPSELLVHVSSARALLEQKITWLPQVFFMHQDYIVKEQATINNLDSPSFDECQALYRQLEAIKAELTLGLKCFKDQQDKLAPYLNYFQHLRQWCTEPSYQALGLPSEDIIAAIKRIEGEIKASFQLNGECDGGQALEGADLSAWFSHLEREFSLGLGQLNQTISILEPHQKPQREQMIKALKGVWAKPGVWDWLFFIFSPTYRQFKRTTLALLKHDKTQPTLATIDQLQRANEQALKSEKLFPWTRARINAMSLQTPSSFFANSKHTPAQNQPAKALARPPLFI